MGAEAGVLAGKRTEISLGIHAIESMVESANP